MPKAYLKKLYPTLHTQSDRDMDPVIAAEKKNKEVKDNPNSSVDEKNEASRKAFDEKVKQGGDIIEMKNKERKKQ